MSASGKKAAPRSAGASTSVRLPRGAHSLPRNVVLNKQRERIVMAAARAVAERGYAQTAVSHILEYAGVGRAAFYELFEDKEDCFLYGFRRLSNGQLRTIEKAVDPTRSLPEQLLAGMTAYLQVLDMDRVLTQAFFVEAEAASPPIREAFSRAADRLETLMRDWHERVRAAHRRVPPCPDLVYPVLRAGIVGLIKDRIRAGHVRIAEDSAGLATLIFASMALYRWAQQAGSGALPEGPPR